MNEEQIFYEAAQIDSPQARREYLDKACDGNSQMRANVDALLKAYHDAGSLLDKPPLSSIPDKTAIDDASAMNNAPVVTKKPLSDSLRFFDSTELPGVVGTLDHYEVLEEIGRGGLGIVLKARDTRLQRMVAIKVPVSEFAANALARKRFQREADAAAAVSHDHVVTIHAVGTKGEVPYLVMELIDGISLQQKLDAEGPLPLKEILRIAIQTSRGLAAAHSQGLVHRDIKPANILLENGVQRVKLTDFGLARAVDDVSMTITGTVAGTPQYMSPEQAHGDKVDHRSDLFSLGSVIYAMCTGRPAFRAESTMAVLKRVCDDAPKPIRTVNPEIPDWPCQIVDKLLSKKPDHRFQSANDVADLLSRHLAHLQQPENVPEPPPIGFVASAVDDQATDKTLKTISINLWANGGIALIWTFVMFLSFLMAVTGEIDNDWIPLILMSGLLSVAIGVLAVSAARQVELQEDYGVVWLASRGVMLPVNPVAIAVLPLTVSSFNALGRREVRAQFRGENGSSMDAERIEQHLHYVQNVLMTLGVLSLVWFVVSMALFVEFLDGPRRNEDAFIPLLGLLSSIAGCLAINGSRHVARRDSYRSVKAGVVASMLPFNPIALLALPWTASALRLLGKPELESAFGQRAESRCAPATNWSLLTHVARVIVLAAIAFMGGLVISFLEKVGLADDDVLGPLSMIVMLIGIGISYRRVPVSRGMGWMHLELFLSTTAFGIGFFVLHELQDEIWGSMIALWLVSAVFHTLILSIWQWMRPLRVEVDASQDTAIGASAIDEAGLSTYTRIRRWYSQGRSRWTDVVIVLTLALVAIVASEATGRTRYFANVANYLDHDGVVVFEGLPAGTHVVVETNGPEFDGPTFEDDQEFRVKQGRYGITITQDDGTLEHSSIDVTGGSYNTFVVENVSSLHMIPLVYSAPLSHPAGARGRIAMSLDDPAMQIVYSEGELVREDSLHAYLYLEPGEYEVEFDMGPFGTASNVEQIQRGREWIILPVQECRRLIVRRTDYVDDGSCRTVPAAVERTLQEAVEEASGDIPVVVWECSGTTALRFAKWNLVLDGIDISRSEDYVHGKTSFWDPGNFPNESGASGVGFWDEAADSLHLSILVAPPDEEGWSRVSIESVSLPRIQYSILMNGNAESLKCADADGNPVEFESNDEVQSIRLSRVGAELLE